MMLDETPVLQRSSFTFRRTHQRFALDIEPGARSTVGHFGELKVKHDPND
jgi:hypothetical protein